MCFRPTTVEVEDKICPECGAKNKGLAGVCEECGAELPAVDLGIGVPSAPPAPGAPGASSGPKPPAAPKAPGMPS